MADFTTVSINEYNDLAARTEKLDRFIDSDGFNDLTITECDLLRIQLAAMETYMQCLNSRLAHFTAKNTVR